MHWIFALLGLLLIATGAIVLGAPYLDIGHSTYSQAPAPEGGSVTDKRPPAATRSIRPQRTTWLARVREFAEKANAPLSILFGFISLIYTRRTYHAQRSR
jgi:hypothetical protein